MAAESLTVGAPKGPWLGRVFHRSPDRNELQVLAFALMTPVEPDTDHPVRTERVRLRLHPRHGIPARAVGRVGEHRQLRLLPDTGELVAHVIDGDAHDKFDRLEPGSV